MFIVESVIGNWKRSGIGGRQKFGRENETVVWALIRGQKTGGEIDE